MGRSSYKVVDDHSPYFLTCTVINWVSIFTEPEIAQIVLDSFRFLKENGRLILYGYVIMENHLHFIASAKDLAGEIAKFKSFTARKIIDYLKEKKAVDILKQLESYKTPHKMDRQHQLWQEGSHPEMIQGEEMMRQKLEYIHYNPVKGGYVDDPIDWKYSSARNYAEKDGLLEVCKMW